MTDYFTLFSFTVKVSGKEEADWLALETAKAYYPDVLEEDTPEEIDMSYAAGEYLEKEGVVLYHDGNTELSLSSIADILQEFLKKFHPDQYIKFSYAFTASKPVIGAFGGGACFITAEEVDWSSTDEWMNEKFQSFKRRTAPLENRTTL